MEVSWERARAEECCRRNSKCHCEDGYQAGQAGAGAGSGDSHAGVSEPSRKPTPRSLQQHWVNLSFAPGLSRGRQDRMFSEFSQPDDSWEQVARP